MGIYVCESIYAQVNTHTRALICVIKEVYFILSVFEIMIKYKEIIYLNLPYESHIKNSIVCSCPVWVASVTWPWF